MEISYFRLCRGKVFVVGFWVFWFFCCFFFLEMKCSACGIQWMDHFEYPPLLLLMLALNRLSPTNSAVDCLAFGLDACASRFFKSRSLFP